MVCLFYMCILRKNFVFTIHISIYRSIDLFIHMHTQYLSRKITFTSSDSISYLIINLMLRVYYLYACKIFYFCLSFLFQFFPFSMFFSFLFFSFLFFFFVFVFFLCIFYFIFYIQVMATTS